MAWFRKNEPVSATESSPLEEAGIRVDGTLPRALEEDRNLPTLDTDQSNSSDDDEWYLTLKRRLHQQVVSEIDISQMRALSDEELRDELFRKATEICNRDANLRALPERSKLIEQVMNEAFG